MSAREKKTVGVGIIGFGVVGSGAAHILLRADPPLAEKTTIALKLVKIAEIKPHPPHLRELPEAEALLTNDAYALIADQEVNIVVEVIGGIEPARSLILEALKRGKSVVTANKKLLAERGRELFAAALEHGSSISFEASVAGGIPLIQSLRDGLVANRIEEILGIVNGTNNYILTKMDHEGLSYESALRQAQARGFAETPPDLDVLGLDAAHKLVLLAELAFHSVFDLAQVHVEGIAGIDAEDIRYARELGYEIKHLALARRQGGGGSEACLELRVHPTMLRRNHPLASVRDEYNGVLIRGDAVGRVMFYGKGAGQMPTGSAIVADIVDAARGTARETFHNLQFFRNPQGAIKVAPITEVHTRYYARFSVEDRPGVLGSIATIMGEHSISIASVIQKEPLAGGAVPLVILTHTACERDFRQALRQIESALYITSPTRWMRVEE